MICLRRSANSRNCNDHCIENELGVSPFRHTGSLLGKRDRMSNRHFCVLIGQGLLCLTLLEITGNGESPSFAFCSIYILKVETVPRSVVCALNLWTSGKLTHLFSFWSRWSYVNLNMFLQKSYNGVLSLFLYQARLHSTEMQPGRAAWVIAMVCFSR